MKRTEQARSYRKGSSAGPGPRPKDPLARARRSYDAVVVGSGLAGLTAANVLAKLGHSVALFEQHYNFGGLATWFKRRGGHVFDVSLHGFPVGMVKTCRRHWSEAIASRIVRLDGVRFDNPQFAFDTDFTREDFADKLVRVFKEPRARVERFFEHVRGLDFFGDASRTTAELFEDFFAGRNDVHRLLLEPIAYANGSSLDDPAVAYGIVFSNFMTRGIWTFTGGTDLLIRDMKAELEANGVDLFNHAPVEKIAIRGGRVTGVECCGRAIGARAVISNAGIKPTVLALAGPEHFPPRFVDDVRAVRLNNSSTQVYLGLRRGESIPFVTDLLFASTRQRFDSLALCDLHGESRTFSFYYPKARPGSDRYTIVSSTNAHFADWAGLDDAAYAREKRRLIEDTLDALDRHVPGVRAKIDHVEASTPRTFAYYTQAWQGASFGTKFEGLKCSFDLPRQVEGLYHAGSVGIIMSGWLGAANYGVIVASKADAWLRSRQEVRA
jgi:phytoene dehydrogenase-like protein